MVHVVVGIQHLALPKCDSCAFYFHLNCMVMRGASVHCIAVQTALILNLCCWYPLQQLSDAFKDVELTGDSAPEFYIEMDNGFPDCRDPNKSPESTKKRPDMPGMPEDNWVTAKRFTLESGDGMAHDACLIFSVATKSVCI
jgi:hypothetical protein